MQLLSTSAVQRWISLIDNSPTVFYNATWTYWSDERIGKNHETLHQVRKCTNKAKMPFEIYEHKYTTSKILSDYIYAGKYWCIISEISSNNLSVCVSTVLHSVAPDITVGDSVHDSVLRISRWGTCRMDLSYSLFYII